MKKEKIIKDIQVQGTSLRIPEKDIDENCVNKIVETLDAFEKDTFLKLGSVFVEKAITHIKTLSYLYDQLSKEHRDSWIGNLLITQIEKIEETIHSVNDLLFNCINGQMLREAFENSNWDFQITKKAIEEILNKRQNNPIAIEGCPGELEQNIESPKKVLKEIAKTLNDVRKTLFYDLGKHFYYMAVIPQENISNQYEALSKEMKNTWLGELLRTHILGIMKAKSDVSMCLDDICTTGELAASALRRKSWDVSRAGQSYSKSWNDRMNVDDAGLEYSDYGFAWYEWKYYDTLLQAQKNYYGVPETEPHEIEWVIEEIC